MAETDAAPNIASMAARLAGQAPNARCQKSYDALLNFAENLAKEGKVQDSDIAYAVKYIHGHKTTPAAQKKRCLAIAMTLLENTGNKGMARGAALRFLGEKHPKGKKIAAKYLNDKEFFVKSAAKRIK